MKLVIAMCCVLAITAHCYSQDTPTKHIVPNSETAIAIAEAVLIPVYGKKKIESERPIRPSYRMEFGAFMEPYIVQMANPNLTKYQHVLVVSLR